MSVTDALRAELAELDRRVKGLSGSTLAALALELASAVDDPGNSATSRSMCAKAFLDAMDRLHALVPAEEEVDALDELTRKRQERIGRVAG